MPHFLIYSSEEVLNEGLRIIRCGGQRAARVQRKTNINRFKSAFGVHPKVYTDIWYDLQTTNLVFQYGKEKNNPIKIDIQKQSVTLESFLLAMRFLRKYDTEEDRSQQSGFCDKWCREWGWYFVDRIAELRQAKIVWPQDDEWKTIFIISTDGVQCRWHEESTPTLLKDTKNYAYKFNGPGLGYHLALHLWQDRLVFLKGPVQPGELTDAIVYDQDLKPMVPDGKKVIVDGGYGDSKDPKLSRPNAHDPPELRKFKGRARARQESFHGRMKRFDSIVHVFRSNRDKHRSCFEAIAVICCYEMEVDTPLMHV